MDTPTQETTYTLLARIDERTKRLETEIGRLEAEIARQAETYVTKAEFWPVRTIVYGGVAAVLLAIVGAIISLVVLRQH